MALHGIAARRPFACAALLALALSACADALSTADRPEDGGDTGPQVMGPFEGEPGESPALAMAASTDCSRRCVLPMKEKLNVTTGWVLQLFGVSETARLVGSRDGGYPFTWKNGQGATHLPFPEGYTNGQAYGLNNWGQAAGYLSGTGGERFAAAWEPNGTPVLLRVAREGARIRGEARAISDSSLIVGQTSDGRAFRTHWRTGFRYLGEPGSAANDVDWDGRAVGYYTSASGQKRPALWAVDGALTDLGALPGHTGGHAVAISPSTGIVVGVSTGGGTERGWIWSADAGMKPLPEGFKPKDVNAYGEVAGWTGGDAWPNAVCGVWWEGYGLLTLPLTPDAHGCEAHSINSWGDVAGFTTRLQESGRFTVYVREAVVWTWSSKKYRYGF